MPYHKKRTWGGKRPNSGRKVGYRAPQTIQADKVREYIQSRILEHVEELLDTKLAIALGNWSYENEDGKVYRQKPNDSTITDLFEMLIGKPKQQIEGTVTPPVAASLDAVAKGIKDILSTPDKPEPPAPKPTPKPQPKPEPTKDKDEVVSLITPESPEVKKVLDDADKQS